MKYSIIIPVYNVEKYIEECIESILIQRYSNYEIILINDCSTDNSALICEKYNKKYDFIKYINNKCNMGISKVRNQGLKSATGDYIIFIDSDDFYNQDFLLDVNNLLKKNEFDLLISSFIVKKDFSEAREINDIKFDPKRINNKTHKEVLEYIYVKRMINTVWRFIIKRSIITDNNLYFIDDIIHEDEEWVPKLLCNVNSIHYFDKKYYTYRIRKNSITSVPNLYNYECYLKVARLLCLYAEDEKVNYKKEFYLRNAYKNCFQAYLGLRSVANPLKREPDKEKHYIKPNIIIYGPSRIGKTSLAKVISHNFNYNIVSIDKLVSSFYNIFPELNINHSDRSGYSQKQMSKFSIDYFNNLSSYSTRINNINYVMEGCYLDIKDVYENIDHKKTIVIVLLNSCAPKEIERNLNKYDKYYDWTYNYTPEEKKEYSKNIYINNKMIKEICEANNIEYWEIDDDRDEVFSEIIKYLEKAIKDKTKIVEESEE